MHVSSREQTKMSRIDRRAALNFKLVEGDTFPQGYLLCTSDTDFTRVTYSNNYRFISCVSHSLRTIKTVKNCYC